MSGYLWFYRASPAVLLGGHLATKLGEAGKEESWGDDEWALAGAS